MWYYLILVLIVLPGCESNDVVEALLFSDDGCKNPIGHVIVKANSNCNCLSCSRWREFPTSEPAAGDVTRTETLSEGRTVSMTALPTGTSSQTERIRTQSLTLSGESSETIVVESRTAVAATETILPQGSPTPSPSSQCGPCGFSDIAVGRATCSSKGVFFLELPTSSTECPATSLLETTPFVFTANNCTRVGSVYAIFTDVSCEHDNSDDGLSGLAITSIIFIVIFLFGIAGAVFVMRKFKSRMSDFEELKSAVQKSAREEKDLASKLDKIKSSITKKNPAITTQVEHVEDVTGVSSVTRSLTDVVIGVSAPSLPIREDLDRLSAHMAEMESRVSLQKQIQKDAMI